MVSSCVAYGCTNRAKKGSGITFHLFPKNAEVRNQWKQAVRREGWEPKDGDQLCSVHFTPECFDRTGQTVRLRHGSLPTVFPEFPKHLQKPVKRKRPPPTPRDPPATGCIEVVCAEQEGEDGATASPTKEHYKKLLHASTQKVTHLQKKVKILQQNKRRLSRRNEVAEEIMKKLKEKKLLSEEGVEVLEATFSP
ncbi:THAP domain-containing protein 1-like [Haemaphysalis longicornis]